ncbi:hypothetical protein [Paludisphaera rhizosphaerae]|uniref:hypothetical protein n=2 Tax=Paludisphaera rhizosphaerae TaxID=2711216 RepID=UPI00197CE419|nr:hypothetical protein [Paludisphaera rhizosphaerae]
MELSEPSTSTPSSGVSRPVRLAGIAAAIACLACLGMVLLEYLELTGYWPPKRTDVAIVIGIVAVLEAAKWAARLPWVEPMLRSRLERWTAFAESSAEWALAGKRPTIAIASALAIILASWAPHYLTWPYWTDHDFIASLALGWDRGRLPWRDQFGFQFPGEIEFFWVLGRVFGWGSSLSFYAADFALLCALLTTVAASCRTCLGRWLAGLTACLWIVGYYTTLPFTLVAQRDWHTAELVAIALMLLALGGSRWTWIVSALLYAAAMTIRPHAVVFFPAFVVALIFPPRGAAAGWKGILFWLSVLGAGLLAMFSPVFFSGLTGDFLRALRTVSHSGEFYGGGSLSRSWRLFTGELRDVWTLSVCSALLTVAWLATSPASRRFAAILLAANACALLYRPMHPVDHNYLTQPLVLFQALAIVAIVDAVTCDAIVARRTALLRFGVLIILFDLAFPWGNPYCDVRADVSAIKSLTTRSVPEQSPPGSIHAFPSTRGGGAVYTWGDYQATLEYLRQHTDASTPVANLLTHFPYPSINAAIGRISPLPIESVILVNWLPDIDFDDLVATTMREQPSETVVICDAEYVEGNLGRRLTRTRETLDRSYVPVARFGEIEIRRRIPDVDK